MEEIDTDWKTTKLKSLAKLFKPFNRDWAPLSTCFDDYYYDYCDYMIIIIIITITIIVIIINIIIVIII